MFLHTVRIRHQHGFLKRTWYYMDSMLASQQGKFITFFELQALTSIEPLNFTLRRLNEIAHKMLTSLLVYPYWTTTNNSRIISSTTFVTIQLPLSVSLSTNQDETEVISFSENWIQQALSEISQHHTKATETSLTQAPLRIESAIAFTV